MKSEHDNLAEERSGWPPAPAERDLAPGRQQIRKEHLMSVIRTETPNVSNAAEPARPRRRRAAVLVPALAALTAAAAVAVVVVATHGGPTNQPAAPAPEGPAVTLLAQVAAAAGQQPTPTVRDDQYEYVASMVSFLSSSATVGPNGQLTPGTSQLAPAHTRQVWIPVADLCQSGQLRENGRTTDLSQRNVPGQRCPSIGSLNDPSYRLLAGLPTDPHALLDRIYAETKGHGTDRDSEAFTTIGDLLRESVPPPAVSAALYRAAALIPGVRIVAEPGDSTGSHTVGVAMDGNGQRTEWIFDRSSLLMVGEREVLTKDGPQGKAGDLVGNTAILTKAIVNHIGDTK